MKTLIAMLVAGILGWLVLATFLPMNAKAEDCNGCGPHKSKFE